MLLCLLLLLVGCRAALAPTPTVTPWWTSTPEDQGMDSARLAGMLEAVEARWLDLDSVLVIRNGAIVAEAYYPPYREDTKHELYSCTKSFCATLVGIAIDQGHIAGVDEPALSLLPGRTFEEVDARKEAMTLEDLLTMTSGLDWPEGDPIYRAMYQSPDWVRYVLGRPMVAAPGTAFNYNSGASHVLSAIVQQATGTPTLRYAQKHLFGPLGIDARWGVDSQGIAIGGWGLQLTPRDMARLGLLYLDEGVWEGQRIVSAEWVRAATSKHVETDGELGYGYQWWTYPTHGAYAALGRGGQMIFVWPQERIVVVFTAGDMDHQPQFDLIEEYILPAVSK
jgi:CubicO group peptidase (beta-lactamase class C family)